MCRNRQQGDQCNPRSMDSGLSAGLCRIALMRCPLLNLRDLMIGLVNSAWYGS